MPLHSLPVTRGKRQTDFALSDKTPTLLVVKRTFDATRPLVFAALTEDLARWHYPAGFEVRNGALELGSPAGKKRGGRGDYVEVVRPSRLVYTMSFPARRGEPGSDAAYLVDAETGEQHEVPSRGLDRPRAPDHEVQVTETLMEQNGETTLTSTMTFASASERTHFMDSHASAGIAFSLDNLASYLAAFSAAPTPKPG